MFVFAASFGYNGADVDSSSTNKRKKTAYAVESEVNDHIAPMQSSGGPTVDASGEDAAFYVASDVGNEPI